MRVVGQIVACCLLVSACQSGQNAVSVGVQSTTEKAVLAQIVRQVIEDQTDLRVQLVECGDLYMCAGDLSSKRIDLIIEYSGTGLLHRRNEATSREGTLEQVRQLYEPIGFRWLDGLGFDSGYLLITPSTVARARGLSTIEDLAGMEAGVRIATPGAYLRRPVDGLSSLLRFYGIRLRGHALVIDDTLERLRALHNGRADVAVVHATDGILRDLIFTPLKDSLRFFPRYEAAVVTRTEVLQTHPNLAGALATLGGRLTQTVMRELNYQVEVEGLSPDIAAHRFLREAKLLVSEAPLQSRQPELVIAMDQEERFGVLVTLAVRAVREVFPDHRVLTSQVEDAVEAVVQGRARLALIATDRFFPDKQGDMFADRDDRIEAAAVLTTGFLHIIRRSHEGDVKDSLGGRVGVSLPGSEQARLATAILHAAGKEPKTFASLPKLLEGVRNNTLDAVLIFAPAGQQLLAEALAGGQLELHKLPRVSGNLPVFLNPVRLPNGTYPGQTEGLDTVGVQIVLAGPAPSQRAGALAGGPAAAFHMQARPLSVDEANALAQAIGIPEPPDPVVPSVWLRGLVQGSTADGATWGQNILDTVLNVAVIVFMVWIGMMIGRRPGS